MVAKLAVNLGIAVASAVVFEATSLLIKKAVKKHDERSEEEKDIIDVEYVVVN